MLPIGMSTTKPGETNGVVYLPVQQTLSEQAPDW